MRERYIRKIKVFGNHFWDFYNNQSVKTQQKIDWTIELVRLLPIVPQKFLKFIEGSEGIYEIRVQSGNNIFRIFCCFDEGQIIILFNGFQKKTMKTPKQEIEIAEKLKQKYYASKKSK